MHMQHAVGAVDVADFQRQAFLQMQAATVDRGEIDLIVEGVEA